ncbi:glycoside hydrolase family 16 protein [Deinococcus misasensis]|uniref:glycoside hydrolase family 16 protein n=1 Tax=Deinococcus misasensis TaxID=392413 RepID=UPI0012F79435|nr:glycoside hydrolase family 16 protein [Deinococcus misasensis]
MKRCISLSLAVMVFTSCANLRPPAMPTQTFFDDFAYQTSLDPSLSRNGWTVREGVGGPGVPGTWSKNHIRFVEDPAQKGNTLMRLTAFTSGNETALTGQAEIYGPLAYLEGTYAARVRFTDQPIPESSGTPGPDGDSVVQTFFTISDPALPDDPNFDASKYSELDFEYLPNGAPMWGRPNTTMLTTSWAAYKNEPYVEEQNPVANEKSHAGWRTVMVTVHQGKVTYFVDGVQYAQHDGKWYPDSKMRLDFNLWFIRRGILASNQKRTYEQDVDWVMHVKDRALSFSELQEQIVKLRKQNLKFVNTIQP